jgi:hypothetical protein
MIEYLAPSGGGGGLPLYYLETDLTGSDFTKLSSVPLTIVPAVPDKFIVPIFFQVAYHFPVIAQDIQITDLFAYNNTAALARYYNFNATDYSSSPIGFITFPVMNYSNINTWNEAPNIRVNSPIVLTSITDNASMNINIFKVRIGYYILEQF